MNIREGTCGVRCGEIQPNNHPGARNYPHPHIPVFLGIKSLTGVIPKTRMKHHHPSQQQQSTWDRYLLQKCGASHVEPRTSSAGATKTRPNPGTSCRWTKISCLCRSSNQQQQQQQPRWLHQLKVIGVFRNDTTNKRNNKQHNHATTSASNKTEKFFTTT